MEEVPVPVFEEEGRERLSMRWMEGARLSVERGD